MKTFIMCADELISYNISIQAISNYSFRIRYSKNKFFKESSLNRYGIINQTECIDADILEDQENTKVTTSSVNLILNKSNGCISIYDKKGNMILENNFVAKNEKGFDLKFKLSDDRIYGMGDVTRDCIQKRGTKQEIWVKNIHSYVPIPFIMSSKGWGIFINTTYRQYFDIGCKEKDNLHIWTENGEIDYYIFLGDNYPDILNYYTNVIGKPALLPIWAYGMTFVTNTQANAKEMIEDGLNFRREGMPCDILGLEPGWMEKEYDYSTEKNWHPERFYMPYWKMPDEYTFLQAVKRLGFKISLWLCCDYDLSYYEEKLINENKINNDKEKIENEYEKDVHLNGVTNMDKITNPDEAWFEHLKKFVDQGVEAFKLDGALQVIDHPDRLYGNGMTDDEMHNLYPILLNKQMSLGYRSHTGRRAMIYSAGGYAGIQKYSATWAGDTGGGAKPLVSLLNHGMTGHSNTSCDMNIFSLEGIHFGFLQPWSQLCSWAYWRHPWLLDDFRKNVFKEYAKLRYRLLPYIYTMAHIASDSGLPIMRAMPLAFKECDKEKDYLNQYMFGDSFLVGVFTNKVYLPKGNWYDYWSGEKYKGGREIEYLIPNDKGGALFVKEGAIIPAWKPVKFISEKPVDTIEIHIYGGDKGTFSLYEDDGITDQYIDHKYLITDIVFHYKNGKYAIEVSHNGNFEGMATNRNFEFYIHGEESPYKITVNDNLISKNENEIIVYKYQY